MGSLNWSSGLPFTPSYGECGSDIPNGPCQPNKAGGIMPTHLTSFSTASHARTYFVPGPAMTTNGSVSGPFSRPHLDQFGDCWTQQLLWSIVFQYRRFHNEEHSDPREHHSPVPYGCFQFLQLHQPGKSRKQLASIAAGAGVITGMAIGQSPRQLEFSVTLSF